MTAKHILLVCMVRFCSAGMVFLLAFNPLPAASVMVVADFDATGPGEIGNESLIDRLGVLGHAVIEVDDDESPDASVDGIDLIVVASSTLSTSVGTHFSEDPVPIVNFEAGLWDELFVSDHGDLVAAETLEVIDTSHPLAELMGMTELGEFVFRDAPSGAPIHLGRYDNLATGATIIAEQPSGGLPTIAVVDTGAELNDGSLSPAPRIMIPFGDEGVDGLNDAGLAVFDAAITYALGGPMIAGDFNGNGELDVDDINMLVRQSASAANDPSFDLNADGVVDSVDVRMWASELTNTFLGDANLDLEFNSSDLVAVFSAGKYEQNEEADWTQGDWSGDLRFSSSDLVAAFSDGGYEQGPKAAYAAVPEPRHTAVALIGLLGFLSRYRDRRVTTCLQRYRLGKFVTAGADIE